MRHSTWKNYWLIVYANNSSSVLTGEKQTNRKSYEKLITNAGKIINDISSIVDGIQINFNLLAQLVMKNSLL